MDRAYDTILQTAVYARDLTKREGVERYRYVCSRCGEEVVLCTSEVISPYFKHYKGNNKVECEDYFKTIGSYVDDKRSNLSSRKDKERVDFYFDTYQKTFCFGIKLTGDEIDKLDNEHSKLILKIPSNGLILQSVPVNRNYFVPDSSVMLAVDKFALEYSLKDHVYEVFSSDIAQPSIFKASEDDDIFRSKAKLIRNSTLYVNTKYIAIFTYINLLIPEGLNVFENMIFTTMGKQFRGVIFEIDKKSERKIWNYEIEESESVMLLWPPTQRVNGVINVNSKDVFVETSFELAPHRNINISDFEKLGDSKVVLLKLEDKIKIHMKNAEIEIKRSQCNPVPYDALTCDITSEKNHVVPGKCEELLFDCYGARRLVAGQRVLLAKGSEIRRYLFGYLATIIKAESPRAMEGEQLLQDLRANYRAEEPFKPLNCEAKSEVAIEYLKLCKSRGSINIAAKRFIEEGLL
ncbi:MAG: hypothetical protein LBT59_03160 [Clostridiales bacterium]|jgi:hypothetical protein|nr:hypothetical protein [Clostridiales bacterium]